MDTGQTTSGQNGGEAALASGNAAFVAVLTVLAAVGLSTFGLVASGTGEPLVFTIIAALATVGVFFLFGLLAGHFRLTPRTTEVDVALSVAECLDDALQVSTRDGRMLFANRAFWDLAKGGASGVLQPLERMFAGQPAAEQALYRLTRAASLGEARQEEFLVDSADVTGAGQWLRLEVRPLAPSAQAHGSEGLVLWRACDITAERSRSVAALNRLDAVLAHYDGLPVGLLVADSRGIEHTNATLLRWLGQADRGAGSVGNLKISDVLRGDGAAMLSAAVAEAAGRPVRLDLDFVRRDGRCFPATVIGCAWPRTGGIAAVVLDRSQMAGADAGHHDTVSARFLQSAPIGIATIAADGRLVTANMALARLLLLGALPDRAPVAQLLGRAADDDCRKAIEQALAAALAGQAQVPPTEIAVGPKGEFTRRVYMTSLVGEGPEAAVLYMIDATEQKALELKYAQSQKLEAVGKLAGGIAHDFNNVLTAIIGWSDLLLQTLRPGDAAFKNVISIKSSAERAADLVAQLLAFSRRQTLQPEVLQLDDLMTDVSVLLRRLLGEKIKLTVHQGRDLWFVKADRTQYQQVVMNLAVNARDAMPDGGELIIRTRNVGELESRKYEEQGLALGEYVLVEVEDTGTGMTPEIMTKIFEPFFTTKGVGKGTGLGLATVYGIVNQTGGCILPESTPGKGTIFRVFLPRHVVESDDEMAPSKPNRPERTKDLTGAGRVLLVEDEDAVRGFAAEALRRQGYEVLQASTGAEALEVLAENDGRVDLVVSDVIMPEMDGPTMLNEMRKTQPHLKIIFVSGYPDDAFKNTLDASEVYAFLPKPFSLAQLATKVKDEMAR